jgi:EAL domain-containing protein (putative c-di-GMP-specific phosphodiesterase class I)
MRHYCRAAFSGMVIAIKSTEIIQNLDLATGAARKVRLHNIALAVDDLGNNWPFSMELPNFPVAEIKVYTEFCCQLRRRPPEADRLPLHSGLAKGYGARTVAKAAQANFAAIREMVWLRVISSGSQSQMPTAVFFPSCRLEARPTIVCSPHGF